MALPTNSIRRRLFDAQSHGMSRFSKLVRDLLTTHYAPVANECKQFNFEVLLEDIKPAVEVSENGVSSNHDDDYASLDFLLSKTSVPATKINEVLHLSAYLRTTKHNIQHRADLIDADFSEQQQLCVDRPNSTFDVDVETLQDLVNLLRANLVQSAVFLKDMQYDQQLRDLLHRSSAVRKIDGKTDIAGNSVKGADDSPVVVPLNKAITIAAILANLCCHFTNRGVDRVYVSNACGSGLLFLKRYAMHTLTILSSNTSYISSNVHVRDLVRDVEVRVADCFINIGRMFANAAPGSLTDQVAYSALTTCMQLFKLQPAIFDSYWGDTLLTSAVNLTPLFLPHLHRSSPEESDADDGDHNVDTGYQDDKMLFYELSSAIIHSPMAVSSSRAALYGVSNQCKIHFTTAMFLISCHSVHSQSRTEGAFDADIVSNSSAALDDEFSIASLQQQRLILLCDKQPALLKCHDFAYTFLRNLFDKLSLSKTKKGSSDEEVSFEVFQCFCDDLLNCLGEPVFPLVPKLLALLFRILLAKLEANRKHTSKVRSTPGGGGVGTDKHALVLDLLTNMIIRVKTFSSDRVITKRDDASNGGGDVITDYHVDNNKNLPLSQQFNAAASAEKLYANIAEFIHANRVLFTVAVEDMCGLAVDDKRPEKSVEIEALKGTAVRTVDDPPSPEAIQIGQTVLLQLFVTHQMLKKCQADSSVFELVQVLHSTWHKYERSLGIDLDDDVSDVQSICTRAREACASISSDAFNRLSTKKRNCRRIRSRKSDSHDMETDEIDLDEENGAAADEMPESGSSALNLARYQLHNHLVALNGLVDVAKQVKAQWGGGPIFSCTKSADDDTLNAAYRLLLLKQNFLNHRIIARIRPLVLWALSSGSALAASKVTRCLSTLIEVDPAVAYDKQLLRALKYQMLRATPSVTSVCLDCIHNIMLSARTYSSLSRNLPIVLSYLTDASKLVRRKSMKMIAQLIANADLRTILITGSDTTGIRNVAAKPKVTLCCKTAAWLILAVNGECLTNENGAAADFTSLSASESLEAEDILMRELATTALSQLLIHLLLLMPASVVAEDSTHAAAAVASDYRDIVGQRQAEFFITLMRVLHDIGLPSSSSSASGLLQTTDYGSGGDSSSVQDTKYTHCSRKVGTALRTVLEHNIRVTAEMQLLIHATATRNRSRGANSIGGDFAVVGGGASKKRIADNLLIVFKRLAQYAVDEMHEQIRRLMSLRSREADNNVPIDEQLELITQFIGQLIEMRPALFAGAMVEKLAQILHRLVWNLQCHIHPLQQQPQQQRQRLNIVQPVDDWRYRALRSLMYVMTRLARCGVIDAMKPAPPLIAPGNHDAGGIVVGDILNEEADESSPSSAATLTGLIRKSIRWFLLTHSYVEPFTCDRFVECWIAVAELERRSFVVSIQNIRRHPSSSQSFGDGGEDAAVVGFVHGRGYADVRRQFERLFNLMRTIVNGMLLTTPTSSATASDASAAAVPGALQQQDWDFQQKKLMTYIQITAYVWRHLPSLSMLALSDDDDSDSGSSATSDVKQYILQILLLCFRFATTRQTGTGPSGSPSAVFKRSLLRLTGQNFRALNSTLRCVGLFAVHYPELLQHPLLAGQCLRDILELGAPPAPPTAGTAAGVQRQQFNLAAKWLYQLKFRVIRIYLQIMDHAFPAAPPPPSPLLPTPAAAPDDEYDDITDVEQRDANSRTVRTERIVTQIMQDRISQFIECGSNGSTLLRRECFLLVQKVFRCRLMLPDRFTPFIIALTCDNCPTIVEAAANLLFEVEIRYPTFLARAALQGVDHAFRHRCRILTDRALAVRAAADWSTPVVVHGFINSSEEQAAWGNSFRPAAGNQQHNDERRSLLSHLVCVIHAASPSPRQAMFTWFRNLIGRIGDMSAGAETNDAIFAGNATAASVNDVSSSRFDLDERLQWQLFIAGGLIYLPYANKDELICLLKAINNRLHPFGAEHFDNLMSSLATRSTGESNSNMVCLQGEQVVKLLDALFTPALLATIKLQLMKMYDIEERVLLMDDDAASAADDETFKKQHVSTADGARSTFLMSALKPMARLSFERTKVVTNLTLLIPMLRQQKVALQMQYRRHHQGSFRIDWKLELNAEQLHVLVEPLKNAVMRAWGDYEEPAAADSLSVTETAAGGNQSEPGYADETCRVNAEPKNDAVDDCVQNSPATPPSSRKQPSRKPTASASKHKSRLLAVKNNLSTSSPSSAKRARPRRRRKSCESSSDDDELLASSSNDDDSNDGVISNKVKLAASARKSVVKRRKLDGDDDDDEFCPSFLTPSKSAPASKGNLLSEESKAAEAGQTSKRPENEIAGGRGRLRPTRQSATVALQRMMNVQDNDGNEDV